MIEAIVDTIKKRLNDSLPGREAQMLMAPQIRNTERYLYKRSKKTKLGAVLILLYPDDGKIKIPLMLRNEYPGVHSGQVSFPGGKQEEVDVDLIQTALRESEEELGIQASNITLLGTLTDLYINASDFDVLPVLGYSSEKPMFIPDPTEVAKVIECDLNKLLVEELRTKSIKINDSLSIDAPFFTIGGEVVWGATAMILSELKEMLSSTPPSS